MSDSHLETANYTNYTEKENGLFELGLLQNHKIAVTEETYLLGSFQGEAPDQRLDKSIYNVALLPESAKWKAVTGNTPV